MMRTLLAALAAALAVAACGGGSSPPKLGGTAAVGAPVSGGTVTVQCAGGTAMSGTTSSSGLWSVQTTGQTFPCIVTVTGGSIGSLAIHSIAQDAGTNANVTPVTDLIVAAAVGSNPAAWLTANGANLAAALTAAVARLQAAKSAFIANLASSGYSVPSGDPFTAPFSPTGGDPYDDLLEAISTSLANSGLSYTDFVTTVATTGTGTLVIPVTNGLSAADIAAQPQLNNAALSLSDGVLTMKTNASAASPVGAYVGGGVGNKAVLQLPGLAGTKLRDLKSLSVELQLVHHNVPPQSSGAPYYGNAPYFNFLIDLDCNQAALPDSATIADARARRRHVVFNINYDAPGAVSTTTFVVQSATSTDIGWAMSGSPTLGLTLNASGTPPGTLSSFDFASYPNACIVDGVSADAGLWRDKTAAPDCNTASALATTAPAKCGRAYSGVILNLGDSSNLYDMEWKVRKVQVNAKTFSFK